MKNNINLITICLCFISLSISAQETISSDTFKVVKEYQPTLINAHKIQFDPEIDDDLKIDVDLDYKFLDKQVPVSFEVEPISPAKIKGEPLVKLYNGYARVGVGNSLIPFAEVYYNNLRSKKYSLGSHVSYFNTAEANNIKGSEKSELHLEAFGKRFWPKNTLNAAISFNKTDFNYYGFYNVQNPEFFNIDIDEDLSQTYNRVKGNFSLKSTKVDSFNVRHAGNLSYNLITNSQGNAENNVKATLNLSQFRNSELYNLDVLVDYNAYELADDNTIIGLKPQISTIGDKFRINAGLGIYLNSEPETSFHFYPLAEVKYNIVDDILVPYIGVKGEIKRVNYNSITLENPFVSEDLTLTNTNERYNLYAGVRGTLSKKVSFNVSGAIVNTENAYLYVQTPDSLFRSLGGKYALTYDDIKETRLKGEIIVRVNEKINIYGLGQYTDFDTEKEAKAWHRPNLQISTAVEYNLKEKLLVRADLIYRGEQYARELQRVSDGSFITTSYTPVKLDGILDANLSFEYRYTKRLSAFIKFNNIAGIEYEKYKDYPTQGFNVWGGFTYGF